MAGKARLLLRGAMWGFTLALFLVAGLFHVLNSMGIIQREMTWGVFMLSAAVVCAGGTIVDIVLESKTRH